jgi:ParB family chromosome partitioning protein
MAKANVLQPYQFQGKGLESLLGRDQESEALTKRVAIAQITLPPQQPRRYFDEAALKTLVASIEQHGVLTPLLVRPKDNKQYELVAGERRYRAAKQVGLMEVPVQIREMSDGMAAEVALLENLQREDLNPVEETEAILALLGQRLAMSQDEVISLLNRGANRQRKSVQNVLHSPEWQVMEQVFAAIGRFTPQSFRASRLRLLKLPEDVLEALKAGKLEFTKAQAIARVTSDAQRQELLSEATVKNLSLREIKDRIHKQDPSISQVSGDETTSLEQRCRRVFSQCLKAKTWENPKMHLMLTKILVQLESILGLRPSFRPLAGNGLGNPAHQDGDIQGIEFPSPCRDLVWKGN